MNDYHWADIAEAPRDGTWIEASTMLCGELHVVEVAWCDGAFRDSSGIAREPEYFVKEGKKS